MRSIYTKNEIIERIKAIDKELEKASISSYNISDGQGSQGVSRDSTKLLSMREFWTNELEKLDSSYSIPMFVRLKGHL